MLKRTSTIIFNRPKLFVVLVGRHAAAGEQVRCNKREEGVLHFGKGRLHTIRVACKLELSLARHALFQHVTESPRFSPEAGERKAPMQDPAAHELSGPSMPGLADRYPASSIGIAGAALWSLFASADMRCFQKERPAGQALITY